MDKKLYSGLFVPCYFSVPSVWNVLPLALHQGQQTPAYLSEFTSGLVSLEILFLLLAHSPSTRKAHQASLS